MIVAEADLYGAHTRRRGGIGKWMVVASVLTLHVWMIDSTRSLPLVTVLPVVRHTTRRHCPSEVHDSVQPIIDQRLVDIRMNCGKFWRWPIGGLLWIPFGCWLAPGGRDGSRLRCRASPPTQLSQIPLQQTHDIVLCGPARSSPGLGVHVNGLGRLHSLRQRLTLAERFRLE
jgi:hypothetical protein